MSKKKINVFVLMGGKTPEHKISLLTGRQVVKHLDKEKYRVGQTVIKKNGSNLDFGRIKKFFSSCQGVVFIAMHGPYGEDGTVQGLLELAGLPYTGSGVLASGLGMDKVMFRKVMENEEIPCPRYLVFDKSESLKRVWEFFGGPPVFVKPANQGSSVGASLVKSRPQLKKALAQAFSYSSPVLVEEYLDGVEVSCGVLGNSRPYALPVAEIISKNEFFDWQAKYTPGKSEEIVPARISKKLTAKVQQTAIRVFEAIGAKGFARVDMIIVNKTPKVLEINTIPGLTSVSILPKEAAAAGISYSQLLDKIIELALEN